MAYGNFYYEEKIFEFLYNASVGLERLLKICVILIEHNNKIDYNAFQESLKVHDHIKLLGRIENEKQLNIQAQHNDFLKLVSEFYNQHRYQRFNLEDIKKSNDRELFISYLEKYIKKKIYVRNDMVMTANDDILKLFIGNTIGLIADKLFNIVKEEAARLNIYTSEIRSFSKAEKIFLRKSYNFIDEDNLLKELLIYFVNSPRKNEVFEYIKDIIKPINFEMGATSEYIRCFKSDMDKLMILDELEEYYSDMDDDKVKERCEILQHIDKGYFGQIEDDEH